MIPKRKNAHNSLKNNWLNYFSGFVKIAFVLGFNLEQFDSALLGSERRELFSRNESYFNSLAKHVMLQGNEVCMYVLGGQEKKTVEIKHAAGYNIFVVPCGKKQRYPHEFSLKLLRLLGKHYREKRFDLAHVHSYYVRMFNPLAVYFFMKRIPFVAQFHGGSLDEKKIVGRIAAFFQRQALGRAKAVIVSNFQEKRKIESLGLKNVFFVPNAIDEKFLSFSGKNAARKRLGLPRREKIVLFAGRLHDAHKGISFLVKAMKLLKQNAKLVVCGSGPDEKMLKELASALGLGKKALFAGFVKGKQKSDFFASSDVVCIPSNPGFEGMPLVCLEAMAFAKPVIATDCAGLNQVIIDGKTGFFVKPKSPEALAKKIDLLLSSSGLCSQMGKSARKRFFSNFSMKNVSKKIVRIYEKILAGESA